MSTPNDTTSDATSDAERMQQLAHLLLEKTRQGRVRWTPYGTGEYTAQAGDLALKIQSDATETRLRLIDQHGRTVGERTGVSGAQGMAVLLQEIHRLAAEQVRNRTIERATEYLRDLDHQPTGANGSGHSRPGPNPLDWLRARLGS